MDYSRGQGYNPSLWWLDVETTANNKYWTGNKSSNANVIEGAVAGLRSMGAFPGIYSTNLQWNQITGSSITFPNIPLWVPGAGYIDQGDPSAVQICADTAGSDYQPFAGGSIVLVQYGYGVNTGSPYDLDYACS